MKEESLERAVCLVPLPRCSRWIYGGLGLRGTAIFAMRVARTFVGALEEVVHLHLRWRSTNEGTAEKLPQAQDSLYDEPGNDTCLFSPA